MPKNDCNKDIACVLDDKHEGGCNHGPRVLINYTNYAKKNRDRYVVPTGQFLFMASPPWHPNRQWMLGMIDVEDGKHKFFAMDGMHGWQED